MALLTADDVLNKKFQSVKFREGYDQVEVDEFLDEVVATIYALQVENNELKEKLVEAESWADGVAAPGIQTPVADLVASKSVAPTDESDPQAASSMLVLARRLHDEFVDEGRQEGEKIVNEAHDTSAKIIREAENKRDEVLADLNKKRMTLEAKISDLRDFEADYRKGISEHLNKLLVEVEASAH